MEKHCTIQNKIHSVIINQDDITDQTELNKLIFSFYQSLFSHTVQNQTDKIEGYLEQITLPKRSNEQTLSWEGIISEDEVSKRLKSMENKKIIRKRWTL